MAKVADKYFKVDSWKIIEEGFNPDYGEVSESIFSLGNEYMGVRGYFEEGYNGPKLIGSYFNGIYERKNRLLRHPRLLSALHETRLPQSRHLLKTDRRTADRQRGETVARHQP